MPVKVLALLVALVSVALFVGLFARVRSGRRLRAPRADGHTGAERISTAAREPARAEGLGARVRSLFAGRAPGEDEWAGLEDLLVLADVGPSVAAGLVARVRERFATDSDPEHLLLEEIVAVLGEDAVLDLPHECLAVVLVVGVNGSGKTTTIGKLAARFAADGRKVALAGSDTFRAAASEQLEVWARRAGAHLVAQQRGADPGAVAFDAVTSARARDADVLIVDTAGRMHTRTPLMDELAKVKRVLEKSAGAIHETLLVLDATTGQNGIAQARAFTESVNVTGVALAKLDGTAKGGIVLAVKEELGVPVKLIGTGEGKGDLEPFEAKPFAERLLRG